VEGLLSEGGKQLLGYGLLGLYAIGATFLSWYLFKDNKECARGARADAEAYIKAMHDVTAAVLAMKLGVDGLLGRMDERTRVTQGIEVRMGLLEQRFTHLDDIIEQHAGAILRELGRGRS
jgi:hypothetical protein